MTIELIHRKRRGGKTSEALKRLRENPWLILICHCNRRATALKKENKDISDRIFSAFEPKPVGMTLQGIIIDDGDCYYTSILIEWINFCLDRRLKIAMTTSI